MVRIMEKNPGIGILQTFPKQIGAETLLGRVMQFAQALYGPAFMAGLNYWQCGEANFWGHNAIIRLGALHRILRAAAAAAARSPSAATSSATTSWRPRSCARRATPCVCCAPTHGSYEEGPPTLIDMLKRDRRWCQGNMQHFWLLFAKGWHPMSRLNFFHGILSYVSSPLWFLFLVFGTFLAATPGARATEQATLAEQLLLGLTVMFIFLPKVVILLDELFTGRLFKPLRLRLLTFFSSMLDTFIFTLMAPVLMVFHTRFVVKTILGQGVSWVAQRRKLDGSIDWREPIFTFGPISALGLVWTVVAYFVSLNFLLWISPILVSLLLAIPLAIVISGRSSGTRFGLFLTPEEIENPDVLLQLQDNLNEIKGRMQLPPELENHYGLVQVFLDPYVNGLHVSLLRRRRNIDVSRDYLRELAERLINEGPQTLKRRELKSMIHDTDTVTDLHYRLWSAAEHDLAPFWSMAIKQYNLASSNPFAHLLAQRAA